MQVIDALQQSIRKELANHEVSFDLMSPVASPSTGLGVLLYAQTSEGHRLASTTMIEFPTRLTPAALAKQEVKARQRGIEVTKRLLKEIESGGVVDEYLADQIIIFMALATRAVGSQCEVLVGKVSLHAETAMRVAEMMLRDVAFRVENLKNGHLIICEKT
jgi:RNA 3'-terminal phosphate cyclase (ATP)